MTKTSQLRNWRTLDIPGTPKVSMAIAAYQRHDSLMCLLYALKSQTYTNWEAVVMHDGPINENISASICDLRDSRIRLYCKEERTGQYGHPLRQEALDLCTGDYIGMTNDDNYYAPVYFEAMLHALVTLDMQLAHCDMVHNYWHYMYFQTKPIKHRCDLGCWIAKASLVHSTPWRDNSFAGDGTYIEDLAERAGSDKVQHVTMGLFVHN